MEQPVFGGPDNRRFTQDSPALPGAWLKYALHPNKARDLVLIPNRTSDAGALANQRNDSLKAYRNYLQKTLGNVSLRDGRTKHAYCPPAGRGRGQLHSIG